MNIRLFPDGTAYVSNQRVVPKRYEGNYFLLPIIADQVNLSSLQMSPQGSVVTAQLASVRKGTQTFDGILKSYTDQYAVISAQGRDLIIREYDQIERNNLLLVSMTQGGPIIISYLTQPDVIVGHVIYRLNLSTGELQAKLQVTNRMPIDLKGVTLDIVTAEQQPQFRTFTLEMADQAPAQAVSTAAGTVYQLEGTHNIPMNQQVTIPLFEEDIEHEILYVFDAPRGHQNALLMLSVTPPVTLPAGTLYVYDDIGLVTTTQMRSIGAGDTVVLELDRVADVYANGTVSVTPINNGKENDGESPQRVVLAGTITNMIDEPIIALVRYFIGDSSITNAASVKKEGNYAQQAFEIPAKQTVRYNMSFTQL